MNGSAPEGPQQTASSRSSALLWTVAIVAVLAGVGLYLARGDRAEQPAAPAGSTAADAAAPVATVPEPAPTPTPPPNYFTAPPCRLFDGAVQPGDSVVDLDPACALPATAKTLAVTISVFNPAAAGTLSLRPAGAAAGDAAGAVLEFQAGRPRNAFEYVPLPADGSMRLGVRNGAGVPVRVILDLSGYFE
jgi:hypothetical protein